MNLLRSPVLLAGVLVLSACQVAPRSEPPGEVPEEVVVAPPPEPVPECVCPAPRPPTVITQPCPQPNPPAPAAAPESGGKYIIGRIENVSLLLDDEAALRLRSRIDTGTSLTSMHAGELKEFERDGDTWVRFALQDPSSEKDVYIERPVNDYVDIRQINGETQRRPVVSMSLKVGAIEEYMDVNLSDRSSSAYKVLIGRNFLRDRAVVDVSRRYIANDELRFVP